MTTKLPVVRKEQENVGESRQIPTEDDDLEAAIQRCKKLVTKRALYSAGAALVPIPGVNITVDVALMASILNSVNSEFGLSPREIEKLSTDQRLQVFAMITAVGSSWAGKYITAPLVTAVLKKLSVQITATQAAKFVPILGQVAGAGISFAAMKFIGNKHIEDCVRISRLFSQAKSKEQA